MAERTKRLEVAAFLDSDQARALGLPARDLQRIAEMFVAACYDDLGKAPWLIDGEDVRALMTEQLPARMGTADPVAEHAVGVIEAFLEHLATVRVFAQAFEARRALDATAAEFRDVVRSGRYAGRSTEREAPFVHGASKLGRNDPCSCGSGKKYKKCHGKET